MPVAAFPGRARLGLRRRRPVRAARAYGGPDGLKRLVDACHGRGLGVVLDVVYNHLGRRELPRRVRPVLHRPLRTPWGDAVNFDGEGSDEVRRFIVDNALHVAAATTTSTACGSTPCTPSSTVAGPHPGRAGREVVSWRARRPLWLIAETELDDPRLVARRSAAATGSTPPGTTTSTTRCTSRSPASATGYYARSFDGSPRSGPCVRRPYMACRAHTGPASRLRRCSARTTTRSATGRAASGSCTWSGLGRLPWRRGRAARRSCRCCSGRGVGRVDAVPVLHRPRRPGAGRAVSEGRRREFAAFGWARRTCPTRRTRRPSSGRSCGGTSWSRASTPRCSSTTGR